MNNSLKDLRTALINKNIWIETDKYYDNILFIKKYKCTGIIQQKELTLIEKNKVTAHKEVNDYYKLRLSYCSDEIIPKYIIKQFNFLEKCNSTRDNIYEIFENVHFFSENKSENYALLWNSDLEEFYVRAVRKVKDIYTEEEKYIWKINDYLVLLNNSGITSMNDISLFYEVINIKENGLNKIADIIINAISK